MLTLGDIKMNLLPFVSEYGIKKAGVFGSYARNQANDVSDIDLIIDFQKEFGLIKLLQLKLSLEEKLGKKIDIVEFSCLNNSVIPDSVLKEVIMLYEEG